MAQHVFDAIKAEARALKEMEELEEVSSPMPQHRASISIKEFAQLHNLSEDLVRDQIKQGTLPFEWFRIGRIYRIYPDREKEVAR